jgi:sulfite exporter TauE/SafE
LTEGVLASGMWLDGVVLALVPVLQLSPETVSANADLLVFFVVGLLAGAHCLGMCGPLVSVYAERVAEKSPADSQERLTPFAVRQHLLFNLGRAAGYAAVGAVLGLLGATLFASVAEVSRLGDGVRGVLGLAVGLFILAAGVGYLRGGAGGLHDRTPTALSNVFGRIAGTLNAHVDRLAGSPGIVGLGLVHAALPCPIIYPGYLYAFAIGDPLRGGLSMAALGLGTIPTLFAYGTMIGSLSPGRRETLHRALGAAFVVLAYVPLSHGLILLGVDVPHLPLPFYQPLA